MLVISCQLSVVSGAGSLEVWKLSERIAVGGQELSECTSHLVEYAANRGFSRITQIARIIGGVMVVGGNCLKQDL